jgi:hypothetical protein
MNAKEIREAKLEAEQRIRVILQELEVKTECAVTDIAVDTNQVIGQAGGHVSMVRVRLEFP